MQSTVIQFPETSDGHALMPAALIVTTDPAPFATHFAGRLDVDVFVTSSPEHAFELLHTQHITAIYADFRQLDEPWRGQRWSGQSLLRELKSIPALASIDFFIMANTWEPHQEQWLTQRMGAAGMVKRDPVALARSMRGAAPLSAPPAALLRYLEGVDEQFRAFGGPMAELHIKAARQALEVGSLPHSRTSYVTWLADKLSLPAQRAGFLATALPKNKKVATPENPTTSALDPWMQSVNKVFTEFAGALGARLIIGEALDAVAHEPTMTRSEYLQRLADRIANPARRGDFLARLEAEKL